MELSDSLDENENDSTYKDKEVDHDENQREREEEATISKTSWLFQRGSNLH